jgi:hypothetical protein
VGLGHAAPHASGIAGAGKFLGASIAGNASDPEVATPCLCVFDVDRTLTGKQGWAGQCPTGQEMAGVMDWAYATGTLLLSQVGSQGLASTFCAQCVKGIVTAGVVSGDNSDERRVILQQALGGADQTRTNWWQDIKFQNTAEVQTSLVVEAVDGKKQDSVRSMVNWWRSAVTGRDALDLADESVWFFDDIHDNVAAFEGTGFNAIQVSCASRGPAEKGGFDGKTGGCGAQLDEIQPRTGVHTCA